MKRIGLLLKLAISIAFILVLLSFVKTNELLTVFARINWFFLLLSLLVTVCMVTASCVKWKLVLDVKGEQISFGQLMRIYLIGYFFSNLLPSTVGGDVVRSYYAGRLMANQSFAAISILVERVSGIMLLFLLVVIAPLLYPSLYPNPAIWIPALAGAGFLGIILWLWQARHPFAWFNSLARVTIAACKALESRRGGLFTRAGQAIEHLYGKLMVRLQKLREELQVALAAIRHDSGFLGRLVGLTLLFYLLTWINVYTSFRAFNVEVSFLAVCAVVPAIMLAAHLPVTLLGNLGYFESVFVFYFLLVGISGAESLAMVLLIRMKMLALGGGGFISYLLYRQHHRLPAHLEKTDIKVG